MCALWVVKVIKKTCKAIWIKKDSLIKINKSKFQSKELD